MKLKPGAAGWLATVAVIVAADVFDQKTMSTGFRNLSRHPVGRYVLFPGWVYLNAHLFGIIPPKYDPLTQLWVSVKGTDPELL